MKQLSKITITSILFTSVLLATIAACSNETIKYNATSHRKATFLSEEYDHFKNGVLFADIETGLTTLWEASFIGTRPYKENIGFFVAQGLLILPNKDNTLQSSRFSSLPIYTRDKKLWVEYQGNQLEVVGIIHTHPNDWGISAPTSRSDYQFSYLGIHNYILSHEGLIDAYLDSKGNETNESLGRRESFAKIPLLVNSVPLAKL